MFILDINAEAKRTDLDILTQPGIIVLIGNYNVVVV